MTPNPAHVHRRHSIYRALHQLQSQGRKRAAVFAAIAEDLETGPAKVPYGVIVRRVIADPLYVPFAKIDPLIDRLVADGYLVIVTEGQAGVTPRVWELGPTTKPAVRMAVPS